MRFVRSGFIRLLSTMVGAAVSVAIMTWPGESLAADEPVDNARLGGRVARLRDRVTQLAGTDDLLDTLHFGWFDRPYARASLAVLIKTTTMLEREVRLRKRGNGAIRDPRLHSMLRWADEALQRVLMSQTDPSFRPHRRRVTAPELAAGTLPVPLMGFVDASTTTRLDPTHGDLDLLAAMGFRVYARPMNDLARTPDVASLRARAKRLGMASVAVERALAPVAVTEREDRPDGKMLAIRPRTLHEWLEAPPCPSDSGNVICAVLDPPYGEPWPSSLARRALARGAQGKTTYVTTGWSPPRMRGGGDRSAAIGAGIWMHVIDGQSVGLVHGWRDLRDGSGSPYPCVLVDPTLMESVAHTGLDIIRLGEQITSFRTGFPPLVIAIDTYAIDTEDDNRWARWITPVWQALCDRQLRFDVIAADAVDHRVRDRYATVFALHQEDADDLGSLMLSIDKALAADQRQMQRVELVEPGGALASDVFVREVPKEEKQRLVALANLTPARRDLHLESRDRIETVMDAVSGEQITAPDKKLTFEPWQVRLLTQAP